MAAEIQQTEKQQTQTPEQIALAANVAAVRFLLAGLVGGKDNADEKRGLDLVGYAHADATADWKAKERTPDELLRVMDGLKHSDIDEICKQGHLALDAIQTLRRTKYQSPLKGGARPDAIGSQVALVIAPSTKQAFRESVKSNLTANL